MARLIVATAFAVGALLAAVATANAATFTIERAGAISMPSSGKLTFGEGSTTIACEYTFNGTLQSGPIEATSGSTFGSITEVTINRGSCSGGSWEGVLGLPWPLVYSQALPSQGELPNTASGLLFTMVGFAILLETFFGIVDCLWSGNPGFLFPLSRTRTAGVYTTVNVTIRSLEAINLAFQRGSEACLRSGSLSGSLTWSPTQTLTFR